MTDSLRFSHLTEAEVVRLANDMAFLLQPADALLLDGDLGAGKSTFARALIRSLLNEPDAEVPSPTFTLAQSYTAPRFDIAHFDFYRLSDAGDVDELGLDAALVRGIAVIEWPSRAQSRLPREHFRIDFAETGNATTRTLTLTATPALQTRLARFGEIRSFLAGAGWGDAASRLSYLQGDASPRRYARLSGRGGRHAILMDAPRQPDGPPIRDGKPYSKIACLAEDVRAFVAVAGTLRGAGLSAPEILAHDLSQGLLLVEDLGDAVFGAEVMRGRSQARLWRRAVETLLVLRATPPPDALPLPDGTTYSLPRADASVLAIECELLLDWYWPALHGASAPDDLRRDFLALWHEHFARVLAGDLGWLLRDFHSPNLIALDERPAPHDVGLIDFQDALFGPLAYDVVSLLQDARLNVDEALERELCAHYIARAHLQNRRFDMAEFRYCYAALGAQRNSKILGIFARLAMRDGKRQYLAHIPRIWAYLDRDLAHPDLAALKAWYDRHLPHDIRTRRLDV